ncbi:hypothetical protein LTR37_019276 [Vermiconidia calcicola]|uniref:Uncharacterized protein n=1 Tax=Vermiconidia calcicola TaxID=1690605 RepID=A0ACC3MFT7_9PEZI|nr:hypothetical protein LTR37_019276 [Vermiconidia calcicola]
MAPPATARYDWILALTTITFFFSAFGNGANDVANSYATSVAARTLSMPQAGILATITEFVGAVALGSRVTDTIKNGIINIDRFEGNPGALMLAMGCAELGNAVWLITATGLGFPVSTTQTIVGSLIGVGFASKAAVTWEWTDGSVSQIAASWAIAPLIAACFAALVFGTLKYSVLERQDSLKWAMRLIPLYLGFTAAILALFLAVELPSGPDLGAVAGEIAGSILAVFFGVMIIGYVFFIPFFKRKLIQQDPRIRVWHLPLGPLLLRENPPLYFPGKGEEFVTNYYEDAYGNVAAGKKDDEKAGIMNSNESPDASVRDGEKPAANDDGILEAAKHTPAMEERRKKVLTPYDRFILPVKDLSWVNPLKFWGYLKFVLLRGVTIDVVTHDSALLRDIHARAHRYDVRVEHMWTYCQVVSAIMMSIAHGSNDVANAVGPWAATYSTYRSGVVDTEAPTPVWFLVVAGLLLGIGFWFFGYHIVRALGNKITQMSPTRGFSTELGAAITVLMASRLGLPVSTTQCLTGAALGVALMNYDVGAVNWRQMAYIFMGWVLTLPCAGLIGGLFCLMALNAPSF